ncbi:MAG TPA: hypothetical protein VK973_11340, partial [Arenicellales bacterium]|nr:hypothetical protein [Arenicellales bacterium]
SQSAGHFQRDESSADDLGSIDFLRRMIVRWGIHPIRAGRRRKTFKSCDLVVGLKPACLALNGFRPLEAVDPGAVSGLRRMIKGTYGLPDAEAADDSHVRGGWEIEDESDDGVKLVCRDRPSSGSGVGVDDLVAVRTGQAGPWQVGTVHWAQTDESGSVSMGVRLIRQTMRPVLIDRLHADRGRVRSEALLLVSKSGDNMTRSLICPATAYVPAATYVVRMADGRGDFVVEATNMRMASRSFAWFELAKPRPDTAQKVLDLINPD